MHQTATVFKNVSSHCENKGKDAEIAVIKNKFIL